MKSVSSMSITQSNGKDPVATLSNLTVKLSDKGEIKNWCTFRDQGNYEAGFKSLGFIEKLQSRFGFKSAQVQRDAALEAVEQLVRRSGVANADVLCANIKNVAIGTGKLRGKDIANVVQNFMERSVHRELTPASGLFISLSDKIAPRRGGVHFLKQSPLALQADRIIVPAAMAKAKGITPAEEKNAADLRWLDGNSYLIGMKQPATAKERPFEKGEVRQRYGDLLKNFSGAVVISPLSYDDDALREMFEATTEAAESNPRLSLSFAIPEKEEQQLIARAYHEFLIKKEDNALQDIDDESDVQSIPNPNNLWEKI